MPIQTDVEALATFHNPDHPAAHCIDVDDHDHVRIIVVWKAQVEYGRCSLIVFSTAKMKSQSGNQSLSAVALMGLDKYRLSVRGPANLHRADHYLSISTRGRRSIRQSPEAAIYPPAVYAKRGFRMSRSLLYWWRKTYVVSYE